MRQEGRYINHLLYASPVRRGKDIEVIEDILPVLDTNVELKIPEKIKNVYLAPQRKAIDFTQDGDKVKFKVDKFECHQMVVLDY